MKKLLLIAGAATLAACGGQDADTAAEDMNVAVTETETVGNAAEAGAADMVRTSQTLQGTTWQFTRDGKQYVESIDENGRYIANYADGSHADHGTLVMKDGKACFTSEMNDEGEECWTVADSTIGETMTTTSDDGETLEVTRLEYQPLTMPSA